MKKTKNNNSKKVVQKSKNAKRNKVGKVRGGNRRTTEVNTGSKGLTRNVLIKKRRSDQFFSSAPSHKRFGNGVRISGTDWLGDVTVIDEVVAGTIISDQIIRPDAFTGARLTQLAPLWERYKVVNWNFHYVPVVAATTPGQLIAYPEYDPLDILMPTPEERVRQAFSAMDAVVWNVYDEAQVGFTRCDPYTDLYTDFRDDDARLSTLGRLILLASSTLGSSGNNTTYGSFFMSYTIDFYIPQLGVPTEVEPVPDSDIAVFTPNKKDIGYESAEQDNHFSIIEASVPALLSCTDTEISTSYFKQAAGTILGCLVKELNGEALKWGDDQSLAVGDQVWIKYFQEQAAGEFVNDTTYIAQTGSNLFNFDKDGTSLFGVYSSLSDAIRGTGLADIISSFTETSSSSANVLNESGLWSDSMLYAREALDFAVNLMVLTPFFKQSRRPHTAGTWSGSFAIATPFGPLLRNRLHTSKRLGTVGNRGGKSRSTTRCTTHATLITSRNGRYVKVSPKEPDSSAPSKGALISERSEGISTCHDSELEEGCKICSRKGNADLSHI